MTQSEPVRVGVIGAGGIVQQRHLPGLKAEPDVRIQVVCNRSEHRARAVAQQWAIPEVETDWRRLVERDDLDAVVIGTWPDTHRDMAVAALETGKHVFCQARMARNLPEARDMLAAADARPKQVAMLCPPPHRMPWEPWIRRQIDTGALGEIQDVRLVSVNDATVNPNQVTFREDVELSGQQALQVGIWAETLNAWLGECTGLSALTAIPQPDKTDDAGRPRRIEVAQVVILEGRLANGAALGEHHSGLARHDHGNHVTIYGSEGTLRVEAMQRVLFAKAGEPLEPVDVPADQQRDWQVEADFIAAVRAARRGESWSVDPDFREGLKYMKKVAAVHAAAEQGRWVELANL